MQSPILQSPLCDKEWEDIIRSAGRSHVNGDKNNCSEMNSEVVMKSNPCLPCWTSPSVLTAKVQ